MSNRLNKKFLAFTLIEVMMVTSIISLLSSVSFSSFATAKKKAADGAMKVQVHEVLNALEVYSEENGGYPTCENGSAYCCVGSDTCSLSGVENIGTISSTFRPFGNRNITFPLIGENQGIVYQQCTTTFTSGVGLSLCHPENITIRYPLYAEDGPVVINGSDTDSDGVPNDDDNCPTVANADQADMDLDGKGEGMGGDACDPDIDGDGHPNDEDYCELTYDTTNQCGDTDHDNVLNADDNCPNVANTNQADSDNDGIGDLCDTTVVCDPNNAYADCDGDNVLNGVDTCPSVSNPTTLDENPRQEDTDGDGIGDACDNVNGLDPDGDGVYVGFDNCPNTPNANQSDIDEDGTGDACDNDFDGDGDGIVNGSDNCPTVYNPGQENVVHGDTFAGDACEDYDSDGVVDAFDVCPSEFNNVCSANDSDSDGIPNGSDNCPNELNSSQADSDTDGVGDACDACVSQYDPTNQCAPPTTYSCTGTFTAIVSSDACSNLFVGPENTEACNNTSGCSYDGASDICNGTHTVTEERSCSTLDQNTCPNTQGCTYTP